MDMQQQKESSFSQKALDMRDAASEKAQAIRDDLAGKAQEMRDAAQDKVQELRETAADKAHSLRESAGEKVQSLKDGAQTLAARVSEKTDGAIHTVGEKMIDTAAVIQEKAPIDGPLAQPLGKISSGLESSGDYLARKNMADIASDTTGLIRKYPIQSLWVGLGLGIVLGSLLGRGKNSK